VVNHDANALGAVRTRVINDYFLIFISAADQQQEIHRSGYVELLTAFQRYGMKRKAQTAKQASVIGREIVLRVRAQGDKANPREQLQRGASLHFIQVQRARDFGN
jgi:hypothetical protein